MSRSRGALIVASIGLLIFLQAANTSILTTTQSSIAADLDAFEQTTWLTSSYLIAMSGLAPLFGRFSQVFSPRLCMFGSTIIITVGTIITSTASSLRIFLVGRVITGSGAAGVFIVASILVVQLSTPKTRGLYIGLVNCCMTSGISLGAVIAGALLPKVGWKPIFGMQAPLIVFAGLGLFFGLPVNYIASNVAYDDLSVRQRLARIDYSGSFLLVLTVVLFLSGLSGPRVLPTPLILSAFSLPVFILNEIYVASDAIIPVPVLKSRATLFTCLAGTGFMMARWCILFYTPTYALAVRGWAPAVAGSILIPTNVGFASGGLMAGIFHIRRSGSFYIPSVVSMSLFPLTLLVLAFISTAESSWGLYVLSVFCNGFIAGASLNYCLVHLLHVTLPDVHPIVLSLLATFRGFAGSFGSAIGGGLFTRVLGRSLKNGFHEAGLKHRGELIRQLLGSPALVSKLEGKEHDIAVGAYEEGVKTLFLGAMGLAIIVVFVQACTGWKAAKKEDVREQISSDDEMRPA
ncbi:MFS multidrug transporter-like protein [Pleomassaria siparia CBS 279.74]|uniref:MFS multidrug transporter-like protein n=1 Tax=Pleomassaria siparia CBS 279.74 TaxID=1314801 RepID=A0A6G1K3D8_9PLEO|nr:MFS multidrug transporter-like protein [Pleomassaria siparia CBS 279.74]